MNDIQKELLTKRFQTTMIGALFEFEKAFGYLWGYNKELDNLTPQELKFNDIWEDVRNKILNNGNGQLRKAILDFSNNNGLQTRYKYNFYTKRRD
jgi:hypothetical protein